MARLKFPGKRARSSLVREKKLALLGCKNSQYEEKKPENSVIKPVVISLRRYREIFGDSDEEVLHLNLPFIVLFIREIQAFITI